MLRKRFENYSAQAYVRLRRHIFRAIRFSVLWFGALGALLTYAIVLMSGGEDFSFLASVVTALLLYSALSAYWRLRELLVAPHNLLVYFSAKVPGFDLMGGVELLRHSRSLDEQLQDSGYKRIGEFVSDDDFFDRSGPTWHLASDGLATIDFLLQHHAAHPSVLAAQQDLARIRERLCLAVSDNIQFCLILRDVNVTNGMEWEQRKGHC